MPDTNYDPNIFEEFTVDYGTDTRILVRFDPNDDERTVQLFNADDLSEIPAPPEGSALRNMVLHEVGIYCLLRGTILKKEPAIQ